MKQREKSRIERMKMKLAIICVVMTVIVSQMPMQSFVHAETDIAVITLGSATKEAQTIQIEDPKENIRRFTLKQDDEVIETKNVDGVLTFEVYTNGTYDLLGYDEQDLMVGEQSVTVDTFEDMEVEEDPSIHQVTILSRNKDTYQIKVSGGAEAVIDAMEIKHGVYQAVFDVKKNGAYTFTAVDMKGNTLNEKTLEISDIPNMSESGEIILRKEDDLKQIVSDPEGSFVLAQDIEVKENPLKGVTFKGTLDGQGYRISCSDSLFEVLDHATIKNIVVKGQLADTSRDSILDGTGYYIEGDDVKQDHAVIMNSENTTIRNSFVMMNVEGRNVAGFVLAGSADIKNSYVSGYLRGETVYGFGKDTDVENSYSSASLSGEKRTLFSEGKRTDCFYDAQINDLEDEDAQPYLTDEITSGALNNKAFTEKKGSYPQIKTETAWKEQAQKAADLSVVRVEAESNLSAMIDSVRASEQKDNDIEWNRNLVRSINRSHEMNGELIASADDMQNRFVLRAAAASVSISAGQPTTSTRTEITYPVTMGTYYIVQESSETAPVNPKTHKEAIESGWKRMYWDGSYTLSGLEWNTKYTVYETDLNSVKESNTITTVHGKNKGTLRLSGDYDIGNTMTATLSDTNTKQGTLYWESAETSDAETWTEVHKTNMNGTTSTDTYAVTDTLSGKYLRARFVTDQASGYTGTLQDISAHSVKVEITKIEIVNSQPKKEGQYTLSDKLSVKLTPDKLNDATYAWYQEGKDEAIGTGMNYKIKGSDVGKKLFVKAIAKADSELKGSIESDHTTVIESIKCATPKASDMITESRADDITVKVKIGDSEGLYHIGIREKDETEITEHGVALRGGSDTTITGLTPNTNYQLYIKEIGEEGYTDSEWSSDFKAFTTDRKHVQGDITITGDLIYGKTLKAAVTNTPSGQSGEVNWYRLNADGSRDTATKQTGDTYTLKKEDVDQKIEVVYSGTGTYAGEISFVSDVISRAEKVAPTQNLSIKEHDDTTITVKMPTNVIGEKYIIGRSTMENGVPVEEIDDSGVIKILNSGEEFKITGLERDTTYYFSVRFAQSATHQKSDWTAQSIIKSQQTDKRTFGGTITFKYVTGDLLRGQTLTAELAPDDKDFNYQGEWTWTKVATDGTETPITNYTLAENRGSTSYVIPDNEAYGTIYTVTFKATVGYEGSATLVTSNSVKEKQKSRYTTPIANDIIMETIDDMSFKVRMSKGEGQYQFEYKKADTDAIDSLSGWFHVNVLGDSTDSYIPVGDAVNSNVDVVVDGLERNTTYAIRVKRVEDSGGLDSEYAYSDSGAGRTVTTTKTAITGYVTIAGTAKYGETLTATYHSATYASTGGSNTDKEGTWQWYRNDTKIAGATNPTYSLTASDIGEKLKAKYTMPVDNDFTGNAEETTVEVSKASSDELTKGVQITHSSDKETAGELRMVLSTTDLMKTDGYYRVQKQGVRAPAYPTDADLGTSWKKVTGTSFEVSTDYAGVKLNANETYVIYYMSKENATYTASTIHELSHTMGTKAQTGNITLSGHYVEGKTLTATLNSANNSKGAWKWYYSKATYDGSSTTTMPSLSDTTNWTELTEGYTPMSDSPTSQLTLTEDMFGKYIKVEFVPNNQEGFSGNVVNPTNNDGFIKRVYEETVTLTSSTSDGNGNPKAYAGTTLTGTVNNSVETTLSRTTARFKIGSSYVNGSISGNTFTYTIPATSTSAYTDGAEVIAEVSKPNVSALYVDKNMNALDSSNLNSKSGTGSTNTYFAYGQGIPISSAEDLLAFMDASKKDTYKSGIYASNTADYIITSNINLAGKDSVSPTKLRGYYNNGTHVYDSFQGTLNGDYHTISNLKNTMFFFTKSTSSSDPVLIMNMLILNANINVGRVSNDNNYNSAGIIVGNSNGMLGFENIFLVDSNLKATYDCGYFLGRANDMFANNTSYFKNCGSVGGNVTAGATAGGLGGNIGSAKVIDCYTIGTKFKGGTNTLSIGAVINKNNIVNNYYTASYFDPAGANRKPFGHEGLSPSSQNIFYDTTIAGILNVNNDLEVGKSTKEIIGDGLKSSFGDTGTWKYQEGFYPRLTWMGNNNIANLYSATRGAFTSVDGATTTTDLFNGNVSGVIQLPVELQKKGYTVTSSSASVLKIGTNGTLIPKSTGTATITITYNDSETGASASNKYDFTVKNTVSEMETVTISNTSPKMNQTLTASCSTPGLSYQWYRRKRGTTEASVISGATSSTYNVKADDVGYELTVLAKKSGYASTYAAYTSAVTTSTSSAPVIVSGSVTDSQATIRVGDGDSSLKYEYAYERADANAKIIVDGTHTHTEQVKIDNLARNKQYRFYVRVAAGDGYEAGTWSPAATATTLKTNVTGSISLGNAVNNGSELTMSIDKLNGQTGTWKVERLDASTGEVKATPVSTTTSANSYRYTLQTADVGSKIRVTFTGSGDYQNYKTATTAVIKKSLTSLPDNHGEFTAVTTTDTSLTVKTPDKPSGKIDVGYSSSAGGDIQSVSATGGITPGLNVTVSGLERNKEYDFCYRIAETDGAEASSWSKRTRLTTAQTAVKDAINVTGTQKVDQTIVFTLTDTNKPTGTWVLSSTKNGKTITISPERYTVDTTKNTLSYTVQPKDAGGILTATFNGTKDFKESATKASTTIGNASQDITTDMPSGLNVTEVSDNSMKISAKDGAVNYQFAYRKSGEAWTPVEASVTSGTVITMEGLDRNTTYEIGIRKSAKIGYDASGYRQMATAQTKKTRLNGLIDYVKVVDGADKPPKIGVAEVDQTYRATYHKGSYPQTAEDDKAGRWQWYYGDAPIEGATTDTYKISALLGNKEISVRYIATDSSDFTNEVIGRVGTLTKPVYDAPASLPTVTALDEDGEIRSKLKIENTGDIKAVYYFVQKASDQKVPNRIPAEDADKNTTPVEGKWFKATATVTLTLDADTDYVVYLAKLEDGSHQASGVVSQRAVRTKKEDLSKIPTAKITETNKDIWKVEETKEIRLTNHKEAPTGIWQYYVSPDKTKDDSWINITAQIKAADTSKDGNTATTFSVPVKYNKYYVKAVFSGRGNYEGSQTYISEEQLIGTQIKGHAEITDGDTSKVLVPVEVNYVFAKEEGKDVVDEKSGQWTWYRVKDGTTTPIVNEDGTLYGKTGISDSYTPGKDDVGAKLYARYTSARNGRYSGSVNTRQLAPIARAPQKKPDAPTVKQIRGITIQMNLPTNYREDGTTIPETVLKYRVKETKEWKENTVGDSWIGRGSEKLKANTIYEVCAMYKVTSEYLPSEDSAVTDVKTGSIPLEEKNLSITQRDVLEAGQTITAIYSGDGYDEGVFTIERSDGTTLKTDQTGTTMGTSTSLLYESTTADIGQRIVVRYSAKADAANYGGSVEKSSSEVVKAKNTGTAVKPVMETELDTNLYVTNVQATQEYILLESGESIADKKESDWTPLKADSTGKYEFTHLERDTSYVLYTRLAETETYTAGNPNASAEIKTLPYNDAGSVEITNKNDGSASSNESGKITIPHSLKRGSTTITALSIAKDSTPLHVQPVSVFANSDGKATKDTMEKGSRWANENFALLVKVYDASGNLRDSGEAGETITVPTEADHITIEIYRANAVSDGGAYTWSLMLEDSERETAVYQGEVTMITQLKSLSPIKIDLNLDGQQIKQSTNDAKVSNELNYMPVTLSVDQKVTKGTDMPKLMGSMDIGLGQIKNDEAYLKLSNDGSDYNKNAGVWFTTDGMSKTQPIYDLGYKGSGGFYISGAVSDEQSWPWDADGAKKTEQAYQISFKTGISENDTKQYEDRAKK